MSATAFLAAFNARFACSTHLLAGREFDQVGQPHGKGSACAECFGCESVSGDMGLAEAGFGLRRKSGQLQLHWSCPVCGTSVCEDTTLLSANIDAREIGRDPLCHRCRNQIRNAA